MNTKRYTLSDAHSTQFYQLPKWLVALRVEAEISNEAILLYTYLRDRVQLSITNKWIDDNGEAYLYFKREQMEKLLGCKKDKVQKIIKELKSVNLLDEVRQGLNQPNRLYLRYPDNSELIEMSIDFEDEDEENGEQEPESPEKPSDYAERGKTALRSTEIPQSGLLKNRTPDCGKSEVKSAEISQSRVLKNRSLDFCKTAPNKTEYNKTKYNKTDSQSDGNFDFLMNADVPEDFAKACISLICEITTTPLSTVRIGKHVMSTWHDSYGNFVKIDHGNGWSTLYAHQTKRVAKVGESVSAGDLIGYVGSTGDSTGNHLHFEIRYNDNRLDPLQFFE